MFKCGVAQAIVLLSAVSEQRSVDACARTFTLKDVAAVDSVHFLMIHSNLHVTVIAIAELISCTAS
jgi:hypothetical protein